MFSDEDIRDDVLDELEFEPSIDNEHIGVAVRNGIVELTGHVASFAQKRAAERATLRVKGVKGVAQEMEVRTPASGLDDDDQIAERAARVLSWSASVPEDRIKVTVEDRWLTLSGEVDWYYQKTAAADAVRELSGTRGMTDRITVAPRISPVELKKTIKRAFHRAADLDSNTVNVMASGGKVTLKGHVHSWHERETAETAAWSAPGVSEVVNQLVVS